MRVFFYIYLYIYLYLWPQGDIFLSIQDAKQAVEQFELRTR